MLVGQPTGVGRHRRLRLSPERAAVGQGRCGLATGLAPGGVGLQVGGLDPRRAQGEVPVAVGQGQGRLRLHGGASTLDLARGLAGLGQGGPHGVAPSHVRYGHQRIAGRSVVGEAAGPGRHVGPDPLWPAALQLGPTGGGGEVSGRNGGAQPDGRLVDGAPARAPAEVGGQGPVHRGLVGEVHALAPGAFQPHDDAGRAEAALAGPGGAEGVGPGVTVGPVESLQGRHRTAHHPPGGRHAGHAGATVDQHRAAAALALGAAAVLGRPQAQAVPQDLQQGGPVVGHLDLGAVHLELQARRLALC